MTRIEELQQQLAEKWTAVRYLGCSKCEYPLSSAVHFHYWYSDLHLGGLLEKVLKRWPSYRLVFSQGTSEDSAKRTAWFIPVPGSSYTPRPTYTGYGDSEEERVLDAVNKALEAGIGKCR